MFCKECHKNLKDFETLIKTAAGLGLGDPSSVLMSRKGWEKCNVTPAA